MTSVDPKIVYYDIDTDISIKGAGFSVTVEKTGSSAPVVTIPSVSIASGAAAAKLKTVFVSIWDRLF